jgi:hypothetical protein
MAVNYAIVSGLGIVAPLLIITARYTIGATTSEYQLLSWLGITVLSQFHVFVSLSTTVTTVLISIGAGATVLLIRDLVFLLR